jgi:hypothetical protein
MQKVMGSFLGSQRHQMELMAQHNEAPGLGMMQTFFTNLQSMTSVEASERLPAVTDVCDRWELKALLMSQRRDGSDFNWTSSTIADKLFNEIATALSDQLPPC